MFEVSHKVKARNGNLLQTEELVRDLQCEIMIFLKVSALRQAVLDHKIQDALSENYII